MGKIINQDGKHYKRCKVIMLPTDNGSNIPILKNLRSGGTKGQLFKTTLNYHYTQSYLKDKGWEAQHIYITSDDGIKEGDYFLVGVSDIIHKCVGFNSIKDIESDNHLCYDVNACKKIIATTDKSLRLKVYDYNRPQKYNPIKETWSGKPKYKHIHLPKPSQEFIETYVKVGGIWEVLVEYIIKESGYCANCNGGSDRTFKCTCSNGQRLFNVNKFKINQNNTITIHPVKPKVYTYDDITHALAYGYSSRREGLSHHQALINFKESGNL